MRRIARMVFTMFALIAVVGMTYAANPPTVVDAEWLKANLDNRNIRIVDVSKNPELFTKGHIPSAVSVNRHLDLGNTESNPPNSYPDRKQFQRLMERLGITPQTVVVVYDDNKSLYATRLMTIMELYGHDPDKLKLLDGGWLYWSSNDYPIAMGEEKAPSRTSYKVKSDKLDYLIKSSDIYRDVVLKAKPEVMLFDARPKAEYEAKKVRAVRGGNIPGSINLTGADFMSDDDHRLKPLNEISQMLESAGFVPSKEIYVYCHSGDRSAHVYWVLTHLLGYDKVRVNDAGWKGWAGTLAYPAKDEVWSWQNR